MNKKILFGLILLLAVILRFWQLGKFPPALTWDEAAIGYNAYGILTVHRDEWLSRMPLTFRSFGDYKSPLGIYMTAASEAVFGVNEFAVRFPVTASGVLLVAATYFLTRELVERYGGENWQRFSTIVALAAMFFIAVSPWALHFSMIAFESTIAANLAAWGVVFFWWRRRSSLWLLASGTSFALSLYAYHSAKIVVPLLILLLLWLERRMWRKNWKSLVIFFVTCLIVGGPLVYISLFGKASDRFVGTSVIFNADKKLKPVGEIAGILSRNFMAHLSPAYLLGGAETNYRQSNMKDGILYPLEAALIVMALVFMVKEKSLRTFGWVVLVIGFSILPATLGADVPHANRAALGMPWFQILAAIGLLPILPKMESAAKNSKYIFAGGLIGVTLLSLGLHLKHDADVYATSTALVDMQYGYKEAVLLARKYESQVSKVYFSNRYQQAYIFILFYKQMSPIEYRGGGLANYVISDRPFNDAKGQANVLVIGTPEEVPDTVGRLAEIKYPDGKVAFRVTKQ